MVATECVATGAEWLAGATNRGRMMRRILYLHKWCPAQEFAGGLDACPCRPARIVVATGRTNCR